MKRIGALSLAVSLAGACAHAQDETSPLTVVFPEAAAIELALSAAPAHLRADATVYVFTSSGFELAREGANGFICLNNRDSFFYGAVAIKPTCWDSHGAATYVPVMLEVGAALAAGTPHDVIVADVNAGFESGRYASPDRLGVAYMLAGDVLTDESGAITEVLFPPHYMFYATDVTDADLGFDVAASAAGSRRPFIFAGGAGGPRLSYLIVFAEPPAAPY